MYFNVWLHRLDMETVHVYRQMGRTALLMIISSPPNPSMLSWTILSQSASTPTSCLFSNHSQFQTHVYTYPTIRPPHSEKPRGIITITIIVIFEIHHAFLYRNELTERERERENKNYIPPEQEPPSFHMIPSPQPSLPSLVLALNSRRN